MMAIRPFFLPLVMAMLSLVLTACDKAPDVPRTPGTPGPSDNTKTNADNKANKSAPDGTPDGDAKGPLVVYCAHDAVFSKQVLEAFTAETGIAVQPRFDSEATKSLALTELLIKEKANPRADVFWNNQWLGTAALKSHDVLEPYKGKGFQRIPEAFRDPDGMFAGFGGRLRVYIVNTQSIKADFADVERVFRSKADHFAVAKPMFGTTLSHYSLLWHLWGGDQLKQYHNAMKQRGVIIRGGNGTTKNLVASGACHAGWTDTDDFYVAKDAGKPVGMLPIRVGKTPDAKLDEGKVILIPNTVAIIKGAKRRKQAEALVDYLLSEANELRLANGRARQIPLGKVDASKLNEDVKALTRFVDDAHALIGIETAREACLAWLKEHALE